MTNPKILNLDELDLQDTGIQIVHEGTTHTMRLLTVEMFIKQQKRQRAHEKAIDSGSHDDADIVDAVELIRDSVSEFFPTLPINDLETPKLFRIFAFLNELTAQMNSDASEDVVADTEGEAGNEQSADQTPN